MSSDFCDAIWIEPKPTSLTMFTVESEYIDQSKMLQGHKIDTSSQLIVTTVRTGMIRTRVLNVASLMHEVLLKTVGLKDSVSYSRKNKYYGEKSSLACIQEASRNHRFHVVDYALK